MKLNKNPKTKYFCTKLSQYCTITYFPWQVIIYIKWGQLNNPEKGPNLYEVGPTPQS